MNPFGSYRALLGNSISAMLGAIEIYNKPQFAYRSECFVILLLNAWELAFKALLSKHRCRIFKPKERGKPYVTLSLWESLEEAKSLFPASIDHKPVAENIGRLVDYRNNAVHFYNETGFEVVIYGLSQTSIVNYRDFIEASFDRDIAAEVNISLLPLSFGAPPDPIKYLGSAGDNEKPAIAEYLKIISDTTAELEAEGKDTGRFLTVFHVHLQSSKKIQSADLIAGVQSVTPTGGMLLVSKKVDPNVSHPHRRKEILDKIGPTHRGLRFNARTFDALVWQYGLKAKETLCWKNENTNTYQYSAELIHQLKAYTEIEIRNALAAYAGHLKSVKRNSAK